MLHRTYTSMLNQTRMALISCSKVNLRSRAYCLNAWIEETRNPWEIHEQNGYVLPAPDKYVIYEQYRNVLNSK